MTLGTLTIVWTSLVAQTVNNLHAMQVTWVQAGSGRSPGEGNGYPLQYYSCLENSMDRGAWQAIIVHGVKKSRTQLSD